MSRLALALLLAATAIGGGHAGSLDPSFGRGGRVFASFSSFDTAGGVAVQQDGKVLVSGRIGGRISIVRFDARGRLDRRFGRAGIVREDVGADPEEAPVRVVLQRDGKIVFAGSTGDFNRDRQLGDGVIAVYRLRSDGSRDRSFGRGGAVLLRRRSELLGSELAIDRSGRLVVLTRASNPGSDGLLVERLTTRGRLDRSFGHGGQRIVRFGNQSFLGSVAVDSLGRIYVAGTDLEQRTLSIARLTARGALDQRFGNRGIAKLPRRGILALPTAVAVQPDGRVVVAGVEGLSSDSPPVPCGYCIFLVLGRFTRNGVPDRTFGEEGVVHTRLELNPNSNPALVLQRGGRIVVAGGLQVGSTPSFFVARLLRSGAFDSSFGTKGRGYTTVDMRSARRENNRATAVAVARDGRVVVAGRSARDALEGGGTTGRIRYRFAVARLLP